MLRGTLRTARLRRVIMTLGALVTAACLVACTPGGAGADLPPSTESPPTTPSPVPPTPTRDVAVRPGALPTPTASVAPVGLAIPSLAIDMPVTDVGVADTGQMELPVDPAIAGWYRYGADATSTSGRILIAAHVDAIDYPIGPLARLRDVPAGETIRITAADGTSREFVVQSLTYYEKAALPTDELFQRGGPSALVLVTCGGPFDSQTGHYRDNVVAVAVPR
ncbi:class F sortase [Microbacterium sp. CFBP9023]|uniref:class F sortase n=1 Tax=unclassified Microbacterium TaxID=2609290 RepID=UPI002A6B70CD|nr:class F sortase [Microbacterium sp. CFBP9023]MDY0983582.1 class F sortase [Microbacterium sp. CFBP9023]